MTGYSVKEIEETEKKGTTPKKSNKYEHIVMPKRGVVLDFEATSPIIEYARVIEIAAIKFEDRRIIDEYKTFVNPGMKVPKAIRELTGITQEQIEHDPKSAGFCPV